MEMRVTEYQQVRKEYENNLQGYVFMAKENNSNLLIYENDNILNCKAKDFWETVDISVMDIDAENPKFKRCEYINNLLELEYENRIIKIKLLNDVQ